MRLALKIWFACLILFIVASSCNQNTLFDKYKKIENAQWKADQWIVFQVQIEDTINPFDIFLNIRNNNEYPFSNLYIFMETSFPDRNIARDTIEIMLADDAGKWLGSGISNIKDNQILLRRNIRFPQKGLYTFSLQQAMRKETLIGIVDIGIKISKTQQE